MRKMNFHHEQLYLVIIINDANEENQSILLHKYSELNL